MENNKIFMSKNIIVPEENDILKQARLQREEKEQKAAADTLIALAKEKQKELEAKLPNLELFPVGINLIILPYPHNPYKKILSDGGIIIDGYEGQFLNPDSGENDHLNLGIGCAKVIEVGAQCKFVKNGDDVFYDTRVVKPIPFLDLGYVLTNEQNLVAIINEGLTERFSNVQ